GAAAGAAVLLAHRFGRNARTDGFLAVYAVYMVLGLAAQSFRLVVIPDLTRAAAEGRLPGETRAWALSFLMLGLAVTVVAILLRHPFAEAITSTPAAAHEAARAVPFIVPAEF